MLKTAFRFGLAVMLCGVVSLSTAGCYGSFNVTRNIHKFNGEVSENQWVQEVVFLVFTWLPVYSLGSLADAIVFNSIEFWTGENPIMVGDGMAESRTLSLAEGTADMQLLADGRIQVRAESTDGEVAEFFLQKNGDGVRAVDAQGNLLSP